MGSFGYRARGQSFELISGGVLVGRAGDEFTCTHDYAQGDECLSFHFAPEVAEELAPANFWRVGCIAPLRELAMAGEVAQAAARERSGVSLDEAGLLLAYRAVQLVNGNVETARVSARQRKSAVEAAVWIDEHCAEPIDLQTAARITGFSPFHFLRIFTGVVGITPHQYLIGSRLRRAAQMLATSELAVTDIALDCGFADVSNFTRSFRRAAGRAPAAFRNFCKAQR
jgi:AraC-like DNA-binding protein